MNGQAAPAPSVLESSQFFWLLLIATMVAMLARRFKVPYALALVITGLLVGALAGIPFAIVTV